MTEAGVNWRRVGTFYGIAFGGAVAIAPLIWLIGQVPTIGSYLSLGVTAIGYMLLPLWAGLITERVARRRTLLSSELDKLRTQPGRTLGRSVGTSVIVMLAIMAVALLATWLTSTLGVPGAGRLVSSDAEFQQRLLEVNPILKAGMPLPTLGVFVGLTAVEGVLAGLTINALFAFGEEYGWRGVLLEELRPLGLGKASLVTGVLWGLWHAPIIVLGHNYGAEWGWGIPLMVAWTIPLAFILTWVRERAGSVLAPSMLHGLFNALIGTFTLIIVGGSVLVALPVGIFAAAALSMVAVVLWRFPLRANARVDE